MEPDQSRDYGQIQTDWSGCSGPQEIGELSLTVVATEIACWACEEMVRDEPDANGYIRCGHCGLAFRPSLPAPRERYDQDYFDQYSGGSYTELEPYRRHEARVRLKLIPRSRLEGNRLLEIGSAAGYFLDEAGRAGWRAVGVEPSGEVARYAREELGVEVRTGFAEDVNLDQFSPDVVCAWHAIEHIPDPSGILVSIRKALANPGCLLIEVPNGASLRAQCEGDEWVPLEPDVHVAQWTPPAMRTLLERAGFSRVETETVPFVTYIASRMRRAPRRVLLAIRQRRWLSDPHPSGNELIRAIAWKAD